MRIYTHRTRERCVTDRAPYSLVYVRLGVSRQCPYYRGNEMPLRNDSAVMNCLMRGSRSG